MLSALSAGALITGASLVCGQAVMALSGRERFSPVAPAAGLSVLLVVCGVAVKLPGHGTTAAIAAGIAAAASIWVLVPRLGDLGPVRWGVVATALIAALAVAIPFATSGRVGILGQGLINDDMASHLLFTEWIDSRAGPTPDLIEDGYPVGPHAIVSAVSKATGVEPDPGLRRADRGDRRPGGADLLWGARRRAGLAPCSLGLPLRAALPRCRLPGPGGVQGADAGPGAGRVRALAAGAARMLARVQPDDRLNLRRPRTPLDAHAGAAGPPGWGDRRGHHLQLQLPGACVACDRRDRLGADHGVARARPPRGPPPARPRQMGAARDRCRSRDPRDRRIA